MKRTDAIYVLIICLFFFLVGIINCWDIIRDNLANPGTHSGIYSWLIAILPAIGGGAGIVVAIHRLFRK
jgi:TRAP-type C4-dicarboxylate transport system permease small subunit